MTRQEALLYLKQRMKEQVADQWLYNADMNRLRQMRRRHEKWEKALFREISAPSFFEGFLCTPKLIGPMKGYNNRGIDMQTRSIPESSRPPSEDAPSGDEHKS